MNDLMSQNYDWGLGKSGQMAKGYLKDIQKGNFGDLPSVQMAVAQGSKNWQDLQRQLQMSSAGMGGIQPNQMAGLLMKGQLSNQNNTGMNALQGFSNDLSNFQNAYSQARGQQMGAWTQGQQLRLGAAEGERQTPVNYGGGILGNLSSDFGNIAKAVAPKGICWVAEELYGPADAGLVRAFLLGMAEVSTSYNLFVKLYRAIGEKWSVLIRKHMCLRRATREVFDRLLRKAKENQWEHPATDVSVGAKGE